MKKLLMVLLLSSFVFSGAEAQDSPDVVFARARHDLQVAMGLVKEAQRIVNEEATPENIRLAMSYYADAGALFEKTAKTFQSLGPDYVRPEDLNGARGAVQDCVNAIGELKKALAQRTQ